MRGRDAEIGRRGDDHSFTTPGTTENPVSLLAQRCSLALGKTQRGLCVDVRAKFFRAMASGRNVDADGRSVVLHDRQERHDYSSMTELMSCPANAHEERLQKSICSGSHRPSRLTPLDRLSPD